MPELPVRAEEFTIGQLLREWRHRGKLSQMSLALLAGTSARHVSFVETGRARPSRELVLRLAEGLGVPPQEWNLLMLAAGYAPVHDRSGPSRQQTQAVKEAVKRLLSVQGPLPVFVHDAAFNIVEATSTVRAVLRGLVASELLTPHMNAMRLSLHPSGLARHVTDFPRWRENKLSRLRHQIELTNDTRLRHLYEEARGYTYPMDVSVPPGEGGEDGLNPLLAPLRLRANGVELHFYSAVTALVPACGVNLGGLKIATFYPADRQTEAVLRSMA